MYSPTIFVRTLSKLSKYEELWKKFIYVIKITSIQGIHFTQLIFPPHCVFCWIARNRNFQPFSAGNINLPFTTMSSRHHPVRTDDWTATSEPTRVLKRHLKILLIRRFTGIKQRLLGRWTLKRLKNLELRKFFLDVKSDIFTWYG